MDKARIVRWAKRAGIALGGLLLLIVLLVAGLFIWLGTDSARRMVLGFAESALAEQGLYLKIDSTSGQLPFTLELKGVSLADKDGVWLELAEAGLEVSPLSLLKMTAQVDSLTLDGLHVIRLPELPPGGEDAAPPEPGNNGPVSLFMPIGIKVGELRLDEVVVEPRFWAGLMPERQDELLALGAAHLNFRADCEILRGRLLQPGNVSLDLFGELLIGGGSLSMELMTGPAEKLPDKLRINILLREDSGGLLAMASGFDDMPAYSVSLASDSSLSDISFALDVRAEDLARLSGNIELVPLGDGTERRKENLRRMISPNWQAVLKLKAEPGPLLRDKNSRFAVLPDLVLGLVDKELNVALDVRSEASGNGLNIAVNTLQADNALFRAGLERASLKLPDGKETRLDFSGVILAEIRDEKFFEVLSVVSEDIPLFGKSSLRLDAQAGLVVGDNGPVAEFSLEGPLRAASRNPLFSGNDVGELEFALKLAGKFDQDLSVEPVRVTGMGLDIGGNTRMSFSPFVLDSQLKITGERAGRWNAILSNLSEGIPQMALDASLVTRLDLSPDNGGQEIYAQARLAAAEFAWPAGDLGRALGPYVALLAEFSGPLASPYQIRLDGVSTGFEPVKPLPYDPAVPLGDFAGARASGRMEISIPGAVPHMPLQNWSTEDQIRLTTLNGTIDLALGDAGLLAPEAAGFSGAVRGVAGISGVAGGDDTRLLMEARLGNYSDSIMESPLGKLELAASAGLDLATRNGLELLGVVRLEGESSTGGPLALDSGWSLRQPDGKDMTVAVNGLEASFAGLLLKGDVSASIAEGGNMPAINGTVSASLDNWQALNEIFDDLEAGIPPVSGAPIDLALEFEHGAGQNVKFEMNLERLHMLLEEDAKFSELPSPGEALPPAGTPGMLILNGVAARGDASDLWGRRLTSAYVKTDLGGLDVEIWKSFAVYLNLAENMGRVNLVMRDDAGALAQVRALGDKMPRFSPELAEEYMSDGINGPDMDIHNHAGAPEGSGASQTETAKAEAGLETGEVAALGLVFRLNPLAVRLERAAVYVPDLRSGLYLESPAMLKVDDSISIRNINFAVIPEGHIKADAYFSNGRSEAKMDIKDFPLALLRKLANIPVPDGELSLNSSMKAEKGNVSGSSKVSAVLRPINSRENDSPIEPLILRLDSSLEKNSPEFGLPTPPGITRYVAAGTLGAMSGDAGQKPDMRLALDIPLHFSPHGMLLPAFDAPLGGKFEWKGEIGRLWEILPVADRHLSGLAQMNFDIGGSLARLEYGGSAYLAKCRYEDRVLGLLLTDIDLDAVTGRLGSRILLAGKDGNGGSLAVDVRVGSGGVINTGLDGGNASKMPELSARGQLNSLAPLHRDDIYIRLSGIFDAAGPLLTPVIRGKFEVEQGNLNLMAKFGGGVSTLPIEARSETQIKKGSGESAVLDISVEAPRHFYVRGPGLESEWQASASISGPVDAPDFIAEVRPIRGYFSLLSRPFTFSGGQVNIWGGKDYTDSSIDLVLINEGNNLTAELHAGGSIKRPSLRLASKPPLPQDQVLSQVLFGKDITQLSAVEAIQVANGVRQLMSFGQGGFDFMGSMRGLLGVDTLRIGSSASGAQGGNISGSPDASAFGVGGGANEQDASTPTVEAGKYINDSIYIGVEQGTVENSTRVRVEVELKPNLTLEGSSGGDSSRVGIGWKRDY